MSINIVNTFKLEPPLQLGGWKELARNVGDGTGAYVIPAAGTFADKKFLMILRANIGSTNYSDFVRFNNDATAIYACRHETDGAGDISTNINTAQPLNFRGQGAGLVSLSVDYVANIAGQEKLAIGQSCSSSIGAAASPTRREHYWKWTNTVNPIDTVNIENTEVSTYPAGAETVVLEWDPTDIHTDNFWEEIGVADASGGPVDTLTVNFTAKKYLWLQIYVQQDSQTNLAMTFNGDGAANYGMTRSTNGATDIKSSTDLSMDHLSTASATNNALINAFIINIANQEKLCMGEMMQESGQTAATAPFRREGIGKWANTTNQITSITMTNAGVGSYGVDTIMKVWGAD